MSERYDIAIVGGSAVGLAAALVLAQDGFRTALVGPSDIRRDGRTIALLNGSIRFLKAIGVWGEIEPDAAPMEMMRIVDDSGSLFRPPPVSFAASEIGLDAFGWNVENAFLVEVLERHAGKTAGVDLYRTLADGMRLKGAHAMLTLADGAALDAALVIAADGRRSPLRKAAGIEARTWTYPQNALTTILRHRAPHRDASCEFHTHDGPVVLVPLPGNRSSLVWVTETERARSLYAMSDNDLAAAVEKQVHSLLGAMHVDGPRGLVPMGGLSVDRYQTERLALVGEAAHVFPPLGAQGLNLGLRDVAALRDCVVDARRGGEDIGGDTVLRRYQSGRSRDAGLRTFAVDALNRIMLTPMFLTDFARGAGLLTLSAISPLRRFVMREGVRPHLDTPRLMRDGE